MTRIRVRRATPKRPEPFDHAPAVERLLAASCAPRPIRTEDWMQ